MIALAAESRQLSPRSLALASGCMVLLFSCGGRRGELPSHLTRFPEDLNNSGLAVTGVYQDGWIGKTAAVNLRQPGGDQALVVRGMVPKIADDDFHGDVELRIDNKVVDRRSVKLGQFQVITPVDAHEGARRVAIGFTSTQQLPGGDNRLVAARLGFIGFEPAEAGTDIVRGPGLQLGAGWGNVEVYDGETFRWVDNDAQLLVTPGKQGDLALSLTIEPGPGVGGPFLLKALDSSGRQVASALIQKRETIRLFLPAEAAKANEFRLHLDGGGRKTPNDKRILNFRVFRINQEPAAGSLR
jgi:hypothetical protein